MNPPLPPSFALIVTIAAAFPGGVTPATSLIIVGVFVVLGALILFTKRKVRIVGPLQCTLYQIPVVFDRLKQQGQDGSFVIFMFQPPGTSSPEDTINIQFSIENGRIGLDWCLSGPANIRDKDKVERFITTSGYKAQLKEMNEMKYLRVDEGDLARLCDNVITRLYGLRPGVKLAMVVEGFSWP